MHRSFEDAVRRLEVGSLPLTGASPTVRPELKRRVRMSRVLFAVCLGLLSGACAESTGPTASSVTQNPGGAVVVSHDGQGAAAEQLNRDSLILMTDQAGIQKVHRKSNYAVAF